MQTLNPHFLTCSLRPRGSLSSSLMRPSSWQLSYRKPSSSDILRRLECCRTKDHASMRHLEKVHTGWLIKGTLVWLTCFTVSKVEKATCCVAVQTGRVWPGRWRKSGALWCGNIAERLSAGPGTWERSGHARVATQTDTERQLDAGAAQMNSDQDKEENDIKKELKDKLRDYIMMVVWRSINGFIAQIRE